MTERGEALAEAINAVPLLLDQAVALGQIECVSGLVAAALLISCGIYAYRRAQSVEDVHLKVFVHCAAALCALIAVAMIFLATEGLVKSFAAPEAYAVRQLLGGNL
jgi:hypothetical protein